MTYTPPEYITEQEVKDFLGPNKVSQVFDDGGDGLPDADPLRVAIRAASALVGGLWASFGASVLDDLAGDYAVKMMLADLVFAIGRKRRTEFANPDNEKIIVAILAQIEKISEGRQRLHAETSAGANQRTTSRGNFTSPRASHLFAPTRRTPEGGGGI
jgi:hypothetical protein